MAIYRVNKTKDYTTISNHHLREKEMSLKAKGLLTLFLSLPENWNYSVNGITEIVKESRNTVNSIMKELENFKYLKRTRITDEKGRFKDWQYDIYEQPYPNFPDMENPDMENPDMENCIQLNTNKLNTKQLNTNKLKEIYKEKEIKKFKKPTLEEVKQYCIERKNDIDPQLFIDYYESNGWKVGKNSMKDWKAAIRTWEKNQKQNIKKYESDWERGRRLLSE